MKARLTKADIQKEAADIDVPYSMLNALLAVESSGAGFLHDDRPKILFERHKFRARLIALGYAALAAKLEVSHPNLCNKMVGGYATGIDADHRGVGEHDRLTAAAAINRQAALESCSWGLGQIMGYHWKALGYSSLQAFVNAMYSSEAQQLDAVTRYINAGPVLLKAMRTKNFAVVAELYNGKKFRAGKYDTKLQAAEQASR